MNLLLEATNSGVILIPKLGKPGIIGRWSGFNSIFTELVVYDPFKRAREAAKLRLERCGLQAIDFSINNPDDHSLRIKYNEQPVAFLSSRSLRQDRPDLGLTRDDGCFSMIASEQNIMALPEEVVLNVNNALLGPFIAESIV